MDRYFFPLVINMNDYVEKSNNDTEDGKKKNQKKKKKKVS